MVDITEFRSHPNKTLIEHTRNVVAGTKAHCSLNIAELAAIFHDVGKMNPNFQAKLDNHRITGYSNHAYLSAYAFLCYCANNQRDVLELFEKEQMWLASILTIIAHHHGNLPDYPEILRDEEYSRLVEFLEREPTFPASDFVKAFIAHQNFDPVNFKPRYAFQNAQYSLAKKISNPINYYLKTKFAFASLILADKMDAGGYEGQGKERNHKQDFSSIYHRSLMNGLADLDQSTELNRLRTRIRREVIANLRNGLSDKRRLFSLTAPTGSGKTIMMLSIADEILRHQNKLRIIYALPFLSIVEQVENECRKIFPELSNKICRIDSKSENSEFSKYQRLLEQKPDQDILKKILSIEFAETTFDYPFVITTFVQVFETVMSNRNASLLKFPHFSNAIFLIDEVQALPPRLYGFFVALLSVFCREFNSYAILSTATMPNFELPKNDFRDNLQELFPTYSSPPQLLSLSYFQHHLFNRYTIHQQENPIEIADLAKLVLQEKDAVLVILNTIQDSKDLHEILSVSMDENACLLLNTHFTVRDRKAKIAKCQRRLNENQGVVLISTQLIEAGVDIDFPVVYRDISPIPNIVQSAGRCNRHGKRPNKGKIVVIELEKEGKSRASFIYKGKDSRFLTYASENLRSTLEEPDMFKLQDGFFGDIQENTLWGFHYSNAFENGKLDFINSIVEMQFAKIGKFKLIDERDHGEEMRFYVVDDAQDRAFEKLERLASELGKIALNDFEQRKTKLLEVRLQLKRMSDKTLNVVLKDGDAPPVASSQACFGLHKLSRDYYDFNTGLNISRGGQIL